MGVVTEDRINAAIKSFQQDDGDTAKSMVLIANKADIIHLFKEQITDVTNRVQGIRIHNSNTKDPLLVGIDTNNFISVIKV